MSSPGKHCPVVNHDVVVSLRRSAIALDDRVDLGAESRRFFWRQGQPAIAESGFVVPQIDPSRQLTDELHFGLVALLDHGLQVDVQRAGKIGVRDEISAAHPYRFVDRAPPPFPLVAALESLQLRDEREIAEGPVDIEHAARLRLIRGRRRTHLNSSILLRRLGRFRRAGGAQLVEYLTFGVLEVDQQRADRLGAPALAH
jgi:hypothetical protein